MGMEKETILACFVGDAACMPLHWIYDTTQLREIVKDSSTVNGVLSKPEFFPTPSCPYYNSDPDDKEKGYSGHYSVGKLSPYGETGYVMLDYFKSTNGSFKGGEDFAQFQHQWFKKYTGRLDVPSKDMLEKAKKLEANGSPLYPECGADDQQTYVTFKLPQLVYKFGNLEQAEFLEIVEQSIRSLQNHDKMVAWGKLIAIMLKNIAAGQKFEAALDGVLASADTVLEGTAKTEDIESIKQIIAWVPELALPLDPLDFAANTGFDSDGVAGKIVEKLQMSEKEKFGALACGYPGSFLMAATIILQTVRTFGGEDTDGFKKEGFAFGLRRNIVTGGDSCGRNWLISSCLSALGAKLPQELTDQFADSADVNTLLDGINK